MHIIRHKSSFCQQYIFLFPFLFLLSALAIFFSSKPLYFRLFGVLEGGLFEWLQFLSYALASIVGLNTFYTLKKSSLRNQALIALVFSVGFAFIALEEISYGQHIFQWATPEYLVRINTQKETNVHNIAIIHHFLNKPFRAIGCYGALSWILRRNHKKLSIRDMVLPEWYISSYFLPTALFYTQLNHHQELFESLLSFGFLIFACSNQFKAQYGLAYVSNSILVE